MLQSIKVIIGMGLQSIPTTVRMTDAVAYFLAFARSCSLSMMELVCMGQWKESDIMIRPHILPVETDRYAASSLALFELTLVSAAFDCSLLSLFRIGKPRHAGMDYSWLAIACEKFIIITNKQTHTKKTTT